MRSFLPIKGPGGRALTPKEKVALLVLGLTLVLCVLTVLAGESAYTESARNPIFGVVAAVCRVFGGGIVGLYAVVVLWSGLIYFKGERVADIAPVAGRSVATMAALVGISGALGIAQVQSAGALGVMVGGALGGVLGGTVGIVLLLGLMLLGFNLAGQGALGVMREPIPVAPSRSIPPPPTFEASSGRISYETALPDDGDPTPDERSLAVTQAMEEIERSHGVTIVEVEPDYELPQESPDESGEATRESIGEEVDGVPPPAPHTEEAEIQRGLREVSEALASESSASVQAPVDEEADVVEQELEDEPVAAPEVQETTDTPADAPQDEAEDLSRVYYPTYQTLDDTTDEDEDEKEYEYEPTTPTEAVEETGFAATEDHDADVAHDGDDVVAFDSAGNRITASQQTERMLFETEAETESDDDAGTGEVESFDAGGNRIDAAALAEAEEQDDGSDPYARGGLLKKLKHRQSADAEAAPKRPHSSFDWRGRPLD